jgi:hypothetical protein
MESVTWSIVVISLAGEASLPDCLSAVATAARGCDARLTVLLNGRGVQFLDATVELVRTLPIPAACFHIPFADKSNAWNQYMHGLAPEAAVHIFVDGYASVTRDAFAALARALDHDPSARAAAALPTTGRSAAALCASMRSNHYLHGSLHALRGSFVECAKNRLHQPVGLYRGDGLVTSMVMHDGSALENRWDPSRIAITEGATWMTKLPTLRDLPRQARRRISQARGRWENAAIRKIIYAADFIGLPRYADEMLRAYLDTETAARPGLLDLPSRIALRQLRQPRTPTDPELTPRRL